MQLEQFKYFLRYEPHTGLFRWNMDRTRGVKAGDVAGGITSRGYREIHVQYKLYRASRLAWLYVHGPIPDGMQIDHINKNRSDDRIVNLRLATPIENSRNKKMPITNTTGFKGVLLHKETGKFVASTKLNGKRLYFGTRHETALEAALAYDAGVQSIHGEFASLNFPLQREAA